MTDKVATKEVSVKEEEPFGGTAMEVEGGETCEVERILDQRILLNGKKEFLIKWKGYANTENSWEPEENCIDCQEIIDEFDLKRKKRELKKKRAEESKKPYPFEIDESLSVPRGFDRGLQPERIVGVTNTGNQLRYLMKWKGSDECDLVPAVQANVKCPQIVIAFFEENLRFAEDE